MSRVNMKGGLALCCILTLIFGVGSLRVNFEDLEQPLLGSALAQPSGSSAPTREEVPVHTVVPPRQFNKAACVLGACAMAACVTSANVIPEGFFGPDCTTQGYCLNPYKRCLFDTIGNKSDTIGNKSATIGNKSATCQFDLIMGIPCAYDSECRGGYCHANSGSRPHDSVCVGPCNPSPSGCCIDGTGFGQVECHQRNCQKTGGCCGKSTGDKRTQAGYCSDVPEWRLATES